MFAEVPLFLPTASHLAFGHQSADNNKQILYLQEYSERANNMVNSYYYENMLKSAHFHDNVGVQCDSGSFSFVDNNLEKNLVW